jgi:hypothetical protein
VAKHITIEDMIDRGWVYEINDYTLDDVPPELRSPVTSDNQRIATLSKGEQSVSGFGKDNDTANQSLEDAINPNEQWELHKQTVIDLHNGVLCENE